MPRHKVKSRPRRAIPNLEPIAPTNEMIDCVIVEHQTRQIYTACARGRCTKAEGEDVNGRCFECFAFMQAANKLRVLSGTPGWTVY